MGSLLVEKIDSHLVDYLHIDQNYNFDDSCYSYCFDSYYAAYNFYDVYFHHVRNLVVHGAVEHIPLVDCNLVDCNLVDYSLVGCNLVDCNLVDYSLVGCNLVGCNLVDYSLVGCNFVDSNLVADVESFDIEHIEHIVAVVGRLDNLNYHIVDIVDKHLDLVDKLVVGCKDFFDSDKQFVVVDSNNFGNRTMVQVSLRLYKCFDGQNMKLYSLFFNKLSIVFKIFICLLLQVW